MILFDLYTCIIIVLFNYFNYKSCSCTLYMQFSLWTVRCSFVINYFTTTAVVERMVTVTESMLKVPVGKQKSFEFKWKEEDFSKLTRKGLKWTIFCVWGENEAADLNLGEKTALWYRDFETALSWSIEFTYKSCAKHLNPPQPPPKRKVEIGRVDSRNQAKWVYILYYIKK